MEKPNFAGNNLMDISAFPKLFIRFFGSVCSQSASGGRTEGAAISFLQFSRPLLHAAN